MRNPVNFAMKMPMHAGWLRRLAPPLFACWAVAATIAVNANAADAPAVGPAPAAGASQAARPVSPYVPDRFAGRAGSYYLMAWGIESPSVKLAESGELVRFTYHVRDPVRAAPLNDKRNAPSLIDPQAGVSLVVPQMEKIGQLRQSAPPQADRSYWIAFSNKGRPVKRGDRVDVVIGPFRATNLVVD